MTSSPSLNSKASAIPTEFFNSPPQGFRPHVTASVCWIHHQGEYLFLQSAPHMREPLSWGVPAGKLDTHETPTDAIIRETREETSIELTSTLLVNLGCVYGKQSHADGDRILHLFTYQLPQKPPIQLSHEHDNAKWIPLDEACAQLSLSGGSALIQIYIDRLQSSVLQPHSISRAV